MEKAYLQWNLPNWITVVLMASLGATMLGIVASGLKAYSSPRGDDE